MKKTFLALIVAAVASPAAAWAVPPGGHPGGPGHSGGPPHDPPGLTKNDDDPGNSNLSPAAECAKERRDLGVSKFNDRYGTNTTDRNAFGKCVSAKAHENADDEDHDNGDDNDNDND